MPHVVYSLQEYEEALSDNKIAILNALRRRYKEPVHVDDLYDDELMWTPRSIYDRALDLLIQDQRIGRIGNKIIFIRP